MIVLLSGYFGPRTAGLTGWLFMRDASLPETSIVSNRKGGCGKTSTAVNISARLAQTRGVLPVDLDPQADAALSFGRNPSGLTRSLYDVLIARGASRGARHSACLSRLKGPPATHALAAAEMIRANARRLEAFLRSPLGSPGSGGRSRESLDLGKR